MAANCIDVCLYQGNIDWAKVKSAGIKYAILRTIRKGLVIDSSFESYYKGAKAVGLKVGVYLYTYAENVSYAKKEAAALVKLLSGRKLDVDVWLDMETAALRRASASTVQSIAKAFRDAMTSAGYKCGIYCDADFYKANSHFSGFDSKCEFWIASYGANDGKQHTIPSIKHHMFAHQFSSRGKVSGVPTYVDVSNVYGVASTASAQPTTTTPEAPATTSARLDMSTLRRGARGYQVAALQYRLNTVLGCALEPDGVFGAKTEVKVGAFQKEHGLTVDLSVGPKTWAKLFPSVK